MIEFGKIKTKLAWLQGFTRESKNKEAQEKVAELQVLINELANTLNKETSTLIHP